MELNELKPIQAGGIDLSEFEGSKATIENIEVIEVPSAYSETGKQMCLQVVTTPVTNFTDAEGEEKPVHATELFNLRQDEDGSWGWSESPKAKIQKFMKKHGVKEPKSLIGKPVVIKIRPKAQPDGSEKEFLGFYV